MTDPLITNQRLSPVDAGVSAQTGALESLIETVRRAFGTNRRRYRRAMMQAITRAAEPGLFVRSSRTDALRAIRCFERVNGFPFDPFDWWHVLTVTNSGWHFSLQRDIARQRPQPEPRDH